MLLFRQIFITNLLIFFFIKSNTFSYQESSKEVIDTKSNNNTLELLKIVASYIFHLDKSFTKKDCKIGRDLISNANKEIIRFKKTIQFQRINKCLETNSEKSFIFINSYGIHHRDFDEMSFSLGGHPTATLLPIILIKNTKHFQTFLQGLKLEIALGNIFNPELYDSPYHPTSIVGLIGSTAISSKIINLTYDETVNALGIALSFLGGIKGSFGSDAKPLQVALSTKNGYFAAKLAKNGLKPNIDLLEKNDVLSIFIHKKIGKIDLDNLKKNYITHYIFKMNF